MQRVTVISVGMTYRFFAALLILVSGTANAAKVDITVRGPDGKPVADAVVTVDTPRAPGGPIRFPYPYEMAQQDILFAPHTLIVPLGASVSFPNRDRVRHHVYSASSAKRFDLKLYGRDETRSLVFDQPGAVSLGCNIHDAMSAVIYVTTSPYTMKTDANGHVAFPNVPAGAATVRVWHPSIRVRGNTASQSVSISDTGYATVLTLRGR